MSTQYRHLFMSYSHKDIAMMRKITSELQNNGYEIWIDNKNFLPGTLIWEVEIEKAIITSVAIVVLLSPSSIASGWVRRELTLADEYRKPIYPVLISGVEETAIPLRLIDRHYIDLRQDFGKGIYSLIEALRTPFEIFSKSEETHDEYRAEIARGQRRPIHELKMLIVGQGSVGKTSLVQKILHGTFDPNQAKTEGISIKQWQVGGWRSVNRSLIN